MNDHEVWQKCWAEFESEACKQGKGQVHSQSPEHEAPVEDERQEHVLRAEEERSNEPCGPAVFELCFESWHDVAKVGGQFGEGNGEGKEQTQKKRPGGQRSEHHVDGSHCIAKDRGGKRIHRRRGNGQADNTEAKEPEQVGLECGTRKLEDIEITFAFRVVHTHEQIDGYDIGEDRQEGPPPC